jgi:adenylate cyclase
MSTVSETNASGLTGGAPNRRKLIAVLYADMVGYSRLIGLDDSGTLERLRALRSSVIDPAIGEHGGRIVQTGGDSLLIVFDSIDGAVRCAVKMQQQVPEHDQNHSPDRAIRFRIGINIGDAIADGTDLHGDAVNVAVRLQAECPPGGICVSRAVHDHVHDRLDVGFDGLGTLNLKNIARPIEAFVVRPALTTAVPMSDERSSVSDPTQTLPLPERPSIAVLPFTNMSGDPEQEYFADGMVEDIITALSRVRWLFVIARNSSFVYKGRAIDIKRVGRELGVRYVLEGSVRKAGTRLRITGQLIDALTGTHLWADRFDGSMEDVFDLQDKVATAVAGVIESPLEAAEIRRSATRPTADLSAYDLYLRSLTLMRSWGGEPATEALILLRRAIERDPDYGLVLALAAFCQAQLLSGGWAKDPETVQREGMEFARRAVRAAPDEPTVLALAAGSLEIFGEDIRVSLAMIDQSLALNPSGAYSWFWSGFLRLFAGSTDLALEHFETSLRLDPRTPMRMFHHTGIGACYFIQRRFDEAAAMLLGSLQQVPTYVTTARVLASCYAHMGRLDEARGMIEHLRTIKASLMPPIMFRNPEQQEFFVAGLRLAAGETA